MNINIGIRGAARELSITDLEMTQEELTAKVIESDTSNEPLVLKDKNGRVFIIPAKALGFIEISDKEKRPVGFGIINADS